MAFVSSRSPTEAMMESRAEQTLAAVAVIWQRAKASILGRVAVLEQATMALLEGTLDEALRQQAEREAHKLVGSLGIFGFIQGSRLARKMERLFQAGTLLGQTEALHLSELVVTLRQELERSPTGQASAPASEDKRPLLLVVDPDTELAEQLVVEAATQGIRAEVALSLSAAQGFVSHERPDVVLLDPSLPTGSEDGLTLLTELTEQTQPVPVFVLTTSNAFVDRVEVARRGGRGFLQKPLPPTQIIEAVAQLLIRLRAAETKVIAVDDDPQILDILRTLLEPRGIKLTTLDDPLRFWTVLQQTSPDLLMLDVDMPHLNGIELCQVVRNDQRWTEMPVLFLTAHADADTIHRVFAAGADDFVSKPIVGSELITRVTNRLERTRLLRTLAETDALTGVANRRKSTQVLDQFLGLANRQGQSFCLAVLDLDLFKRVNDRYGHAAGDEVLRRLGELLLRTFRGEDVIARWGGEEFVVGMYGMRHDDGVQRLADMLEALRQEEFRGPADERFRVTFSAGVAEYPTDGVDLQALYRAADQALYQAKAAGRDRVLPTGWRPEQGQTERRVDVVLVDDDEALADLLLYALKTRGYRTHWIKDGQEAAVALGGPSPALGAQVILLDVDLPGLDGLSVLRRLAQDGVVPHSRVIMLTVRSAEAEVLTALELGAFDHVAKPFSLPVLMQRVRRALQV